MAEINKRDPKILTDYIIKKSLDFKDNQQKSDSYNVLNKLDPAAVKKVIRPDILKNDQNTIKHIISAIKHDEDNDEYHRDIQLEHQILTRQRLLKRHELNIAREQAAGIHRMLHVE